MQAAHDDDPPSDADLIAWVADGDGGALRLLYDRHSPWLAVRLRRRCSDADAVAEVLQDTFVAVWRGARRYRGEGDVAAWIWGIAIRRLISRVRSDRRAGEIPVAEVDPGTATAAEDLVLLGVEHGDLAAALSALSPQFRAVIRATVLDGLTTREAAELLGIPEGTVKTRAHRARAQLRASLSARPIGGL